MPTVTVNKGSPRSPEELWTIARALVKHKGWGDFLQQVAQVK